jgi:hypothetical protein
LNWRAIIPLYVQGYSVEEIESLVSLDPWEKLLEHMLQVDHTRWRKFAYAKPSVQSIIDFYHTALDKH